MIKINLLKALKESSITSNADSEFNEKEPNGFLAKLLSPFNKESELKENYDEVVIVNLPLVASKAILMISIVLGLIIYESINIPKLKQQLEDQNAKLLSLNQYNEKAAMAVAEIKKQQEHKAIIERQIASLDGLSKVRLKYIKVLDLIQSNIPERLWFSNLKTKDNLLEVSGLAANENDITNFLDIMGKSIFFSDVSMQSSEDVAGRDANQRKYKKYSINFILEDKK